MKKATRKKRDYDDYLVDEAIDCLIEDILTDELLDEVYGGYGLQEQNIDDYDFFSRRKKDENIRFYD